MNEPYSLFPKKHILPYDGMSITASVWGESHHYHNQMQNVHQVFLHGAGIVRGLEVVASDPADTVVFVLPGVAIDDAGQMIVLSEPVAYDLGKKMNGKLYLLLLHREVKLQNGESAETNAPAYMQDEFVIVARPDQIDVPHVELARVYREKVDDPISDAANPYHPEKNCLDLRFRQVICPPPTEQVLVGVSYLGKDPEKVFAQAMIHLAKPLRDASPYQIIVEDSVALDAEALNYGLLYLVADKAAKLDKKQADLLRGFIEGGGKILVEFSDAGVEEKAIVDLLKPAGISLQKASASHPAFQSPYLFFVPPQGGFANEKPAVWVDESGVIASNGGYGLLLGGQNAADRSAVRDGMEWAIDLVSYLLSL